MIDEKEIETVSHTIDEVLMYMSHTHEMEPLILASLFLARITLMCDETGDGKRFREICKQVSEKEITDFELDYETKMD